MGLQVKTQIWQKTEVSIEVNHSQRNTDISWGWQYRPFELTAKTNEKKYISSSFEFLSQKGALDSSQHKER